MNNWLLRPDVFYPMSILLFAIWFAFFSGEPVGSETDTTGWLTMVLCGVAISFGSLSIAWLSGMPLQEVQSSMIFEGSAVVLRRFVAIGYLCVVAGLIQKFRSFIF